MQGWQDWQDWLTGGTGKIDFGIPETAWCQLEGLEVPFWYPGTPFGWSRDYLGHPTGRFGVQTWIFIDLGWIFGFSRLSLGDPWRELVMNQGAQIEENERKAAAQEGARTKSVIRLLPRWPNVAPVL